MLQKLRRKPGVTKLPKAASSEQEEEEKEEERAWRPREHQSSGFIGRMPKTRAAAKHSEVAAEIKKNAARVHTLLIKMFIDYATSYCIYICALKLR